MARILIIDDDQVYCMILAAMVQELGHEAVCRHTLRDGFMEVAGGPFDIVLLDVRLPDGNGLERITEIKQMESAPEVIIITATGEASGAELAIRHGAWDYIEKPSSLHTISLPIIRALQYRDQRMAQEVKREVRALHMEGIIGRSPKLRVCIDLLAQISGSEASVLIGGETGTGKELFASAIHRNSRRAKKPFVVVDCAALPETLVESVLFGHAKGAFTGADKAKDGLIKEADGGTLFLDEIGELPLAVQKAFLRVLQEKRFRPVGSNIEASSDFRLIAATNRDLTRMVQDGSFRSDLLFRIRSFTLELPPLRSRAEDLEDLLIWHMGKLAGQYATGCKAFSPDFMEALKGYTWPGNVREFGHAVERAFAAAQGESMLFPKHLPDELRISLKQSLLSVQPGSNSNGGPKWLHSGEIPLLKQYREAMDRQYLEYLLTQTQGDAREASKISGLSRSRLYDLLKLHDISTSA